MNGSQPSSTPSVDPTAVVQTQRWPQGDEASTHRSGLPAIRADAGVLADRGRYLAHVDHTAAVGRMRALLPMAVVLWVAFFAVDAVVATWVHPSSVMPFVVLRGLGMLPLLLAWAVLRRAEHPTPRHIMVLDLVMMVATAGSLSGMCVVAGGLQSPYHAFIVLVLIGRAAVLPHRWQDGVWRLGIPALLNPLVVGIASCCVPEVAAQWGSATARGTYFFYGMLISGAWMLLVIGSHNAWALRRQVFTSRSLGRFKLRELIGRGGMGEVWIARDEQLRRDVALKVLRPIDNDPAAVRRFEREILATAELRHPNTIRIFSHGVSEDGLWYYAMELLDGESLGNLVQRVGPLPPRRAAAMLDQAARALAEAHAHGLIHRDVKPDNLFVTTLGGEPDVIKVLDFGIVRSARDDEPGLTSTGYVAGTPAYMAPEVVQGDPATPSADVYALGAALYFALTGRPPFEDTDPTALLRKHVHAQPTPPSRRVPGISEALDRVCLCALAKNPRHRFVDARAFAEALRAASA
ncbi:MAG: serine/threonine-protein kinase [Myxococcota bacterium]